MSECIQQDPIPFPQEPSEEELEIESSPPIQPQDTNSNTLQNENNNNNNNNNNNQKINPSLSSQPSNCQNIEIIQSISEHSTSSNPQSNEVSTKTNPNLFFKFKNSAKFFFQH